MDYQTYLNSLKFGNVSDTINTFKNNVASQFELPLDMKSLDLQTTINNLTDAKSNEDAKDGIIGSALSGLGMSGENLALLKNIYNNAKEKLGIGDFKVGDKIDELKDLAKGKLQDLADGLKGKAQDVADGLKGKAQDVIDNVKSNIQDTVEGVQQNIKDGVNSFTGGGNTTSEIEMTEPSSWQPEPQEMEYVGKSSQPQEIEMQDLSKPQTDGEIGGEIIELDDTDYMSKPAGFQSNTQTTGAETAETGAETAETGAETGAETALETGAETALETGAETALETAGSFLDGTGALAPIGIALQLAGLGASIYQAVSDSDATATITSDENAQNALKQQADTFKQNLESRMYAGSNVLGSLSSVGSNSITSSFF
jgi:hypothetical protein